MNNDYSYSYEWDQRYCYPHSSVLINKLGIEDAEKLHIAEREITSLRIANAKISVIKGEFDLLHLKKIHKYIFGDIYEWAGEIRWVNIAKGNMFEASAASFLCDYTKMNELFSGITSPLQENTMTQTFTE